MSNIGSKVVVDELGKIRYLYKIPKSVEIRSSEPHERVDWVILGWVVLYEFTFNEGMRLLIPKLVRCPGSL